MMGSGLLARLMRIRLNGLAVQSRSMKAATGMGVRITCLLELGCKCHTIGLPNDEISSGRAPKSKNTSTGTRSWRRRSSNWHISYFTRCPLKGSIFGIPLFAR